MLWGGAWVDHILYTWAECGAEGRMRTLLEAVRSMLFFAHLDKDFWGFALIAANYISNRLPTCIHDSTRTGKRADIWNTSVLHQNPWGEAWTHIPKEKQQSKLDARARKMRLIGFGKDQKDMLRWEETNEIFISYSSKQYNATGIGIYHKFIIIVLYQFFILYFPDALMLAAKAALSEDPEKRPTACSLDSLFRA